MGTHHDPHAVHHPPAAERLPTKTCITTYIALMVLLVATYAADHIGLGSWSTAVNMVISIVKSCLVIWVFMEARYSSRLTLMAFGSGILMMIICAILSMADYMTRAF